MCSGDWEDNGGEAGFYGEGVSIDEYAGSLFPQMECMGKTYVCECFNTKTEPKGICTTS